MRVESFLADAARRFPDKAALVVDGRRVSYSELDKLAGQLANVLRSSGVGRGDRVVIPGGFVGPRRLVGLRQSQGRGGIQPDQPLDQAGQAGLCPEQLSGEGGNHSVVAAAGGGRGDRPGAIGRGDAGG